MQELNNNATLPKRSIDGVAVYDLCVSQNCTIPAKGKGLVQTKLVISFLASLYAHIALHSGLAVKKFCDVGLGVVDVDYRGGVGVVLFNHGDQDFVVKMGDRISQIILEKIDTFKVEEVQVLGETVSGTGNFGNTRVKKENDTEMEKEMKGKNEEIEDKNETLEGSNSGKESTDRIRKPTEGTSRLS